MAQRLAVSNRRENIFQILNHLARVKKKNKTNNKRQQNEGISLMQASVHTHNIE